MASRSSSPGRDCLKGGENGDLLVGSKQRDRFLGGPGADTVKARDGLGELTRCGQGFDKAIVDFHDATKSCEVVRRAAP
jgi:hypothetical protein